MKGIRRHVRKGVNVELSEDGLTSEDVGLVRLANVGIPNCSNCVAYDSIQRMLAVGTTDGRIKLVGGTGVEETLDSPHVNITKSLTFVKNKGCLLRLDEGGVLELWSVATCQLLDSLEAPSDDAFTCLSVADFDSHVVVGCVSGGVRLVNLADNTGQLALDGRNVCRLGLAPVTVSGDDLGAGDEPVEFVEVRYTSSGGYRVMVRHGGSSVTVWDVKGKCRVARQTKEDIMSIPQLRQAWEITSVCWASREADSYVTGHQSGLVCHWRLNDASPQFCNVYEVCDDRVRDAVQGLSYIVSDEPVLLVMGGNMKEVPASLSRINLPRPNLPEEPEVRSLPWFGTIRGYALVMPYGSFSSDDVPTAIIAIAEGGCICIYDLKKDDQKPFSLEFQAHPVFASSMSSLPVEPSPNQAVSMSELREHGHAKAGPVVDWSWVLSSGTAADNTVTSDPYASVLVTGHQDGSATLWDVASEVPAHMYTLKGGCSQQVTAVAADWAGGLLAVGHEWGQVDVYQWCLADRSIDVAVVGDSSAKRSCLPQPAGWQRVLMVAPTARDDAAACLAWHCGTNGKVLLAIGYRSGAASLLDCAPLRGAPKVAWQIDTGSGGVGSVAFCMVPEHPPRLVLLVVTFNASLRAFDAYSGEPHGSAWTVPKNSDTLCSATALTAHGVPVTFEECLAQLKWAGDLVEHSPKYASRVNSARSVDSPSYASKGSSVLRDKAASGSIAHDDSDGGEDADDGDVLAAAAAEEKSRSKPRGAGRMIKSMFAKSRNNKGQKQDMKDSFSESASEGSFNTLPGLKEPTSPSMSSGDDSPSIVACVLVVTSQFIRLYPRTALGGDRTCIHKLKHDYVQHFAAPFVLPSGPGLLVMSQTAGILLYSLPGLKPLMQVSFDAVTGWSWDWGCDQGVALKHIGGRCALCCNSGKLAVIGPCQELLMLSVDTTSIHRPLNKCHDLFDRDMAAAAHSAETAFRASMRQRKKEGGLPSEHLEKVQKGFVNFFKQAEKGLKMGATGIVDIGKLATTEVAKIMDLSQGQGPEVRPRAPGAARPDQALASSQHGSLDADTGSDVSFIAVEAPAQASPPRPVRRYGPDVSAESTSGSRRDPARPVGPRTAADIRSAYGRDRRDGRSAAGAAGDTAAIMNENVSRLRERGERLERLEDRGADLEKSAANFAEMAKQLQQQANKPWWKLG